MANQSEPSSTDDLKLYWWAAWAIPPDNICKRVKIVMEALRQEFGGPEIKPHITVAGSCLFTRSAIEKFNNACGSVNPLIYQVDQLESSKFYFQCVSLVFKTDEEFSRETGFLAGRMHCNSANMPHLSLLYGYHTDEEKKRALEMVKSLDEELCTMNFTVSKMQLYKVNFEDKTQKSWEMICESNLRRVINNCFTVKYVLPRITKEMEGLRTEFGGPEIEPQITVVGSMLRTEEDAIRQFKDVCDILTRFECTVDHIDTSRFFYRAEQEALEAQKDALDMNRYAVWGIIPESVYTRVKKVMEALREEFGGPEVEPHITIVGSSIMSEEEANDQFVEGCNEVNQFICKVDTLETSKFYFQCVSLVMEVTEDLKEQTRWFAGCMHRPFPCMPHLSLIYGSLTEEEKTRAREKVLAIDPTITELQFLISRVALYRVNFADPTQKSWVKVREGNLKVVR